MFMFGGNAKLLEVKMYTPHDLDPLKFNILIICKFFDLGPDKHYGSYFLNNSIEVDKTWQHKDLGIY